VAQETHDTQSRSTVPSPKQLPPNDNFIAYETKGIVLFWYVYGLSACRPRRWRVERFLRYVYAYAHLVAENCISGKEREM
jgi:hypothetical protein